ncbi:EAL domain-containing protein [Demequina aurantiaca]|uniref:EAL domain-containing protein n=1 Tax=Demequina aurantiaca TaxID=676200 RepID=UPI003D3350AC
MLPESDLVSPSPEPRLWHHTHPEATATHKSVPILVGRQGLFTAAGELLGYELLFRAAGFKGSRCDLWTHQEQDLATEHVIAAALHQGTDVTRGLDASVNFSDTYLLAHRDLRCDPRKVIIEITESSVMSDALLTRIQELRAEGFRVALDDFVATDTQCQLLPFADFVKIDLRDISGREDALLSHARGNNRVLVAERVETQAELAEAVTLGFHQFQGHLFEPTEVVSVPSPPAPSTALAR